MTNWFKWRCHSLPLKAWVKSQVFRTLLKNSRVCSDSIWISIQRADVASEKRCFQVLRDDTVWLKESEVSQSCRIKSAGKMLWETSGPSVNKVLCCFWNTTLFLAGALIQLIYLSHFYGYSSHTKWLGGIK